MDMLRTHHQKTSSTKETRISSDSEENASDMFPSLYYIYSVLPVVKELLHANHVKQTAASTVI